MTLVEHEPKQTIIENGIVYNYKRTFDDVSAYSTKREWDDYLCLSTGGSVGFGCHWVVDYYEDSNKKGYMKLRCDKYKYESEAHQELWNSCH